MNNKTIIMTKKLLYITPEMSVVEIGTTMPLADSNPDVRTSNNKADTGYEALSRRHRNVWEDENVNEEY